MGEGHQLWTQSMWLQEKTDKKKKKEEQEEEQLVKLSLLNPLICWKCLQVHILLEEAL